MSVSNGKISAPVSIADVKSVLGNGSNDLGTLCQASQINKWAKYKPVRYPYISTTDQWDATNQTWKSTATWWKGSGVTEIGGIVPYTTTARATLLSQYTSSDPLNGWVYNRPTGGQYQPFRLTDFAKYNHGAPAPLANFYMQAEIKQDGTFTASAMMSMTDSGTDYISMADFSANAFPNGLYFGVMFVQNGTGKLVVTADTKGAAQISANFSGSGNMLPLGSYTVYPILCRDQIPITQTTEQSNLYMTAPNVSPVTVQIVSSSSTVDVELTPTYTIGRNIVSMNIANNTSTAITDVTWYITSSSSHPTSGGTNIGSIAAGGDTDILNKSYTSGQYFHVSFRYSGSTQWKSMMLLDNEF